MSTNTMEPTRERWEFEDSTMRELPGFRAISARNIDGSENFHGGFAHVLTRMEDGRTHKAVTQRANLVVNAPELLAIADRLFNFYELHKHPNGGGLGLDFKDLRAKIMGEVNR
jgi:hypothetical protein